MIAYLKYLSGLQQIYHAELSQYINDCPHEIKCIVKYNCVDYIRYYQPESNSDVEIL